MKFEVRKAILNQTFFWKFKKTNFTYKWSTEKYQGENQKKSLKAKENKIPTNTESMSKRDKWPQNGWKLYSLLFQNELKDIKGNAVRYERT